MERNIRTLITFIPINQSEENAQDIVNQTVAKIRSEFDLVTDVFVYERMGQSNAFFATFKADITGQNESPLENTKFINRNPKTNTLFSINALNRICQMEIGKIDPTHTINWNRYRNKILMLRNSPSGEKEFAEHDIRLISRFDYQTGVESIFNTKEQD
jgi:hypothetical protein